MCTMQRLAFLSIIAASAVGAEENVIPPRKIIEVSSMFRAAVKTGVRRVEGNEECFNDVFKLMSSEELSDAENKLMEDFEKVMAGKDDENCKLSSTGIVCTKDMTPFTDDYKTVCEGLGGEFRPMNYNVECPANEEMPYPVQSSQKNTAFCMPSSCHLFDMDEMIQAYLQEEGLDEEISECTMSVDLGSTCSENPKAKFLMPKTRPNGQTRLVRKNCAYLKTRPGKERETVCSHEISKDGMYSANIMCPLSCCLCAESKFSKFVLSMKSGTPTVKNCAYIKKRKNSKKQSNICNRNLTNRGQFNPAEVQCGESCGYCSP